MTRSDGDLTWEVCFRETDSKWRTGGSRPLLGRMLVVLLRSKSAELIRHSKKSHPSVECPVSKRKKKKLRRGCQYRSLQLTYYLEILYKQFDTRPHRPPYFVTSNISSSVYNWGFITIKTKTCTYIECEGTVYAKFLCIT